MIFFLVLLTDNVTVNKNMVKSILTIYSVMGICDAGHKNIFSALSHDECALIVKEASIPLFLLDQYKAIHQLGKQKYENTELVYSIILVASKSG